MCEGGLLMARRACIELTLQEAHKTHTHTPTLPTRDWMEGLTWCTVHVGQRLLVTALLHVAPAAEVGELNVT